MEGLSIYLPSTLRNALRKEAVSKGLTLVTHIRSILMERQTNMTAKTPASGK
jgi:hypothetical protein